MAPILHVPWWRPGRPDKRERSNLWLPVLRVRIQSCTLGTGVAGSPSGRQGTLHNVALSYGPLGPQGCVANRTSFLKPSWAWCKGVLSWISFLLHESLVFKSLFLICTFLFTYSKLSAPVPSGCLFLKHLIWVSSHSNTMWPLVLPRITVMIYFLRLLESREINFPVPPRLIIECLWERKKLNLFTLNKK